MRNKIIVILFFTPVLVWGVGQLAYTLSDQLGIISFLGQRITFIYRPGAESPSYSAPLTDYQYELSPTEAAPRWALDRSAAPHPSYYSRTSTLRGLIEEYADYYSDPPDRYIIPVVGTIRASLVSSFGDPRPGGRTHQGIDMFAARGTEVVSATDGVVVRAGYNHLGGNAIMVFGEGLTVYYYAHLDSYVPELKVGQAVYAGQIIGYVGNTGNAATTPTHLHFGMYQINPGYWWMTFRGGAVDPFPFLMERGKTIRRGIRVSLVPS
jgi:murein DD-endopeptidase MepM/ murein hydrolase activator NlpD